MQKTNPVTFFYELNQDLEIEYVQQMKIRTTVKFIYIVKDKKIDKRNYGTYTFTKVIGTLNKIIDENTDFFISFSNKLRIKLTDHKSNL